MLQDFDFGDIGPGWERMSVLLVWGTAAGEYCQKHETLAVRGLQYVFVTRLGIRRAFLPMVLGVVRALVQIYG